MNCFKCKWVRYVYDNLSYAEPVCSHVSVRKSKEDIITGKIYYQNIPCHKAKNRSLF